MKGTHRLSPTCHTSTANKRKATHRAESSPDTCGYTWYYKFNDLIFVWSETNCPITILLFLKQCRGVMSSPGSGLDSKLHWERIKTYTIWFNPPSGGGLLTQGSAPGLSELLLSLRMTLSSCFQFSQHLCENVFTLLSTSFHCKHWF